MWSVTTEHMHLIQVFLTKKLGLEFRHLIYSQYIYYKNTDDLFDLALHKGPNDFICSTRYLILMVANENLILRNSETNGDTRLTM